MKINKKKAYSLVEILLALSIIMVLSISVFITYSKIRDNFIAAKEVSTIIHIKAQILSLYKGSNNYDGLDQPNDFILKTIYPANVIKDGAAYNSYGGQYLISISSSGEEQKYFLISSPKISDGDCFKIASALKSSFNQININGTNLKTNDNTIINNSDILSLCKRDNDNVLGFKYF